MKQGLIEVYCGDGKGKTTAALGLILRASGRGLKVILCQFSERLGNRGVKDPALAAGSRGLPGAGYHQVFFSDERRRKSPGA
jgi:ATP:corrinoid adenosyltransferase